MAVYIGSEIYDNNGRSGEVHSIAYDGTVDILWVDGRFSQHHHTHVLVSGHTTTVIAPKALVALNSSPVSIDVQAPMDGAPGRMARVVTPHDLMCLAETAQDVPPAPQRKMTHCKRSKHLK